MDATLIIVVVIAVLVVAAGVAAWLINQKKRSEQLKERFGPEYERAVSEKGQTTEAEKELQARAQRVEKLHIRELPSEQQQRFSGEWQAVQAHFVDEPKSAIGEADDLVQRVMDARGYPLTDFDQQAADISVDHPEVVSNYRAAHSIAQANDSEGVGTEQLRQAMLHYRALFNELLGVDASSSQVKR